jgi:hypothetical protein
MRCDAKVVLVKDVQSAVGKADWEINPLMPLRKHQARQQQGREINLATGVEVGWAKVADQAIALKAQQRRIPINRVCRGI